MGVLVGDARCWILGSLQGRRGKNLMNGVMWVNRTTGKKSGKMGWFSEGGNNIIIKKSKGWSHWGWRGSITSLQALC